MDGWSLCCQRFITVSGKVVTLNVQNNFLWFLSVSLTAKDRRRELGYVGL